MTGYSQGVYVTLIIQNSLELQSELIIFEIRMQFCFVLQFSRNTAPWKIVYS